MSILARAAMERIGRGYVSAAKPDPRIYTFNQWADDEAFPELRALGLIESVSSTWVPGAFRLTALGLAAIGE